MTAEVAVPVVGQGANTTDAAPGEPGLSGIPNTAPLDLFPQVYFPPLCTAGAVFPI